MNSGKNLWGSTEVQGAIKKVASLTEHRVGWKMISKHFKLCSSLDGQNKNDVTNLFESLIGNFEGIVQYNKDNRAFEGAEWQNVTIETICDLMLDESQGSKLDRLALVNDLVSLKMEGQTCLDHTYQSEVRNITEHITFYITTHHITSYFMRTHYNTKSHHITLQHITLHYITLQHITSHHPRNNELFLDKSVARGQLGLRGCSGRKTVDISDLHGVWLVPVIRHPSVLLGKHYSCRVL